MNRSVYIFGAMLLSVAAHAQASYTDVSFAGSNGLSGVGATFTSTPSSYTANLTGGTLTGSTIATTTWEFDFAESHGQKLTGFDMTISGTISGETAPNQALLTLSSLDITSSGSTVFTLATSGGPVKTYLSNGNFTITYPVSSNYSVTTPGGVSLGDFSTGETYQAARGTDLKITSLTFGPQVVPEPASFIALGIPAIGLFLRKRRQ
jgi:hypothetical protein